VPEIDPILSAMRRSQILRLCLVGVLTLVLLIPIVMISGLVTERQARRESAVKEVSSKWGDAQAITGPALVLPFIVHRSETSAAGEKIVHDQTRYATFLPKQLGVEGKIEAESRYRGIFSIPVYTANLSMQGEFAQPDLAELGIESSSVLWNRAHLALAISDVRAIREQSVVSWNDKQFSFIPGSGGFLENAPGVHAQVEADSAKSSYRFSFPISLNGSLSFNLAPFAEQTVTHITSNSPSPNFQGNWLPVERRVSDSGFEATWRIPYLGRNYPQSWVSDGDVRKAIDASRFGVELSDVVDHYRMADRSVKYAGLFILLTFASIWLIEVLAKVRVHPIQYLMLGAGLCVFYLLELSLSEHIGFGVAYAIACTSIIGMTAVYSRVIFPNERRSAVVATCVAALYGYLFVLLTNEDYALLIGSIGLFVILAGIMYVTRRVDWYANGKEATSPTGVPRD
jgi:inner membrane protein